MIHNGFKINTKDNLGYADVVIYEKKRFLGIIPYWKLVYQNGDDNIRMGFYVRTDKLKMMLPDEYAAFINFHYDRFIKLRKAWEQVK